MKCPFCQQSHTTLITKFNSPQDEALVRLMQQKLEAWTEDNGVCSRCLDKFQIEQMLTSTVKLLDTEEVVEVNGFPILPLPVRLLTHPAYTGKGITMCFIDSGFSLHPDLTKPVNRIKHIMDITDPHASLDDFNQVRDSSWHGSMTTVVGAGNGYSSDGRYRSIASEAELVLIKVMKESGGISGEDINKALEWVLTNHESFDIRVLNLSVTGDWPTSYKKSPIAKNIHALVECGITVVAAAGNDVGAVLLPPANVPEALTIGGLDDSNTLNPFDNTLYHSTFGITVDQIHKPEVIAPAIWVPAPILIGSDSYKEVGLLTEILQWSEDQLGENEVRIRSILKMGQHLQLPHLEELKEWARDQLKQRKAIHSHYQHADGTSFAAPITCSVIAQMLEANNQLTPVDIREILISTARPVGGESIERQGFGVIQPLAAVNRAAGEKHSHILPVSPLINYKDQSISFGYHHHNVKQVAIAGDFNNWQTNTHLLKETEEEGFWQLNMAIPENGVYNYKFVINDQEWITDPRNAFKEPDGFNGFNSKFFIEMN